MLPEALTQLIEQFKKLPGIGAKGAQRLAFHVLRHPREDAERLCEAIREVKERVTYCSTCHNITDTDPCAFCTSTTRDQRVICVVEEAQNVNVVEKSREFRGAYHVLMGALSPLQGVGPDDLTIKDLLGRVGAGGVDEVILATNPTVEGEATALYLARLLKPLGVRVTRIAMGIPVGSDLEYADEVTMSRAMEGRRELLIPASYQLPAAIVLVLGGTVSCFFGYRLFRIVLAIAGFILGWAAASSVFGASDTLPMVVAGLLGGLIGAGILIGAYFVGVALVGAGLGAFFAHVGFGLYDREPPFLALLLLVIAGAVAASYLQRYFIIVGTSFGGAWTLIVGAMALVGDKTALSAAAAGDVWVAYPLNPAPDREWLPIAWIVLGLIGTAVQMGWTGGEKGRVGRRKKKS